MWPPPTPPKMKSKVQIGGFVSIDSNASINSKKNVQRKDCVDINERPKTSTS